MPFYRTDRFYEATEPPPAHRPQISRSSHSPFVGMAGDRPPGLGNFVGPVVTPPDRPLSSNSTILAHMGSLAPPEMTLMSHLPPERPLSSHSLGLGAGLDAAGSIMEAVGRPCADGPSVEEQFEGTREPTDEDRLRLNAELNKVIDYTVCPHFDAHQ